MMESDDSIIEYSLNTAKESDVFNHLTACDLLFVPPLNTYTKIKDYAQKLYNKAIKFEAWSAGTLIGLIAVYLNEDSKIAFISNVSVLDYYQGKGVSSKLLLNTKLYIKSKGIKNINLEVFKNNLAAIKLYEKYGFYIVDTSQPKIKLTLTF